jgi:hypothetical protein
MGKRSGIRIAAGGGTGGGRRANRIAGAGAGFLAMRRAASVARQPSAARTNPAE